MTARETILRDIQTGLGRPKPSEVTPPPVRLRIPEVSTSKRIARMLDRVIALAGHAVHVKSGSEAAAYVEGITQGEPTAMSQSPFLREMGIASTAGSVETAKFGITGADYALTDTGTLVMIASPADARLVSLLPPVHIAVMPVDRLLSGLDELYTLVPKPADQTSSIVFITGPSRTADIEQRLVRGVHGPGEIHVVLVG